MRASPHLRFSDTGHLAEPGKGSEAEWQRPLGERVWRIDRSLKTTYISEGVALRLGKTPSELQGHLIADFLEDEGAVSLKAAIEVKLTQSDRYEFQVSRPDGSKFYANVPLPPLQASKNLLGAVTIQTDSGNDLLAFVEIEPSQPVPIPAERRTQEATVRLQYDKELLEVIMENTSTQIAYLDKNFRFLKVNNAYAKGIGRPMESLIGKSHFELLPSEENEEIFRKVMESGEPVEFQAKSFEFMDQPWRGVTYWDWSVVPIKDDQGKVQGLVLSLIDVTAKIVQEKEKERLLNRVIDANADLTKLINLTTKAISTLELRPLLHDLMEVLVGTMGADAATILLLEGDEMHAYARSGSRQEDGPTYSISKEEGIAGLVMGTKAPIYIEDAQKDSRVAIPTLREAGARSVLGFPLTRGAEMIGVLHVDWLSIHPYQEREAKLLKVAAERCSQAIINSRLYTVTKEQERLDVELNEINVQIANTYDIDTILKKVLSRAVKAIGVEAAAVMMKDAEKLRLSYIVGQFPGRQGVRYSKEEAAASFRAMGLRVPIILEDVSEEEGINRKFAEKKKVKSMMVIPLVASEEVLGTLNFAYLTNKARFAPSMVDFAIKLSVSVSLAMENAKLFQKEKSERQLLQTVIDSSPSGIAVFGGAELRVQVANDAIMRILGPDPKRKSIIGLTLPQALNVTEDSRLAVSLRKASETGKPYSENEYEYQSLKRGPAYWAVNTVPLPETRPDQREVMLVISEMTNQVLARKSIEKLATEAEAERSRLRAILDTLPVGVMVADGSAKIVESNGVLERIWRGSSKVNGLPDLNAYRGWWADTGIPLKGEDWGLSVAIAQGKTVEGEVIDILRPDGSRGTILTSAAPIKDSKGATIGAVMVVQDISQQRRLEHEALESKAQAELYLDLMSQDMGALLANVLGHLQMVMNKPKLDAKTKSHVEFSIESMSEASRLIDIVGKIKRLEAHDIKYELTDVGLVLADVVERHRKRLGADASINYKPVAWFTSNASDLLNDAFSYLIEDSMMKVKKDLNLDIEIGEAYEGGRQFHKVVFEDNVSEMHGKTKADLFAIPRRGKHKSTVDDLRLYLVRMIIEDHHGRIWLESRVRGDWRSGRRFVVMIPSAILREQAFVMEGDSQDDEKD